MLEFIILGTLLQRDLTGYDIRKCIESGIGIFFRASFGSIYPLLTRLTEQGMVSCTEDQDAKRRQKLYAITEKGKNYFDSWLMSDEQTELKAEAFMAKVFFFDRLEKERAGEQLEDFQRRVEAYLEGLLRKENNISGCRIRKNSIISFQHFILG